MRRFLLTALALTAVSFSAATTVTVQPGDTLTRLAVRSGTTAAALRRANPGVRLDVLPAGTVLRLPDARGETRAWTVRPGDTLSRIAQRQGLTLQALLKANPALDPRRPLRVGQRLSLPPAPLARARTTVTLRPASVRGAAGRPLQGRLTTPFQATHPGLDLAAPSGTPIRAVLPGTVTESRFDGQGGWGWTVVLDHGGGLTSRYSHNSANLVRVGARVNAGEVIARVGSTGNSSGAHVDYRLYQGGRSIDPSSLQ
ncbi:LysM peptidoglycan-binding domain-containing M23 family metallopeptidase [Deinococcus aestuarii]|uniref:LysM peptidoglycan-binding domain-containing M23 family metallopeptidase n=1 Tax=Deinococcus aestuarii TaxID=2774531 RepID=UPI001C0B00B5|nr:M23 family metallopeptidase [Deinococcus aestuarii]